MTILSDTFILRWQKLEQAHGCIKGDLLRISQIESGVGQAAVHPATRAAGLIQHMPSQLKACGWGGTPEEYNALPIENQVPYCARYFARFGKLETLADAYGAVFWPISVGQPSDYVISGDSHSLVYRLNAVLDNNGDGKITKGELDPSCRRFLRGARWRAIEREYGLIPEPETSPEGTVVWLQAHLLARGFYAGEIDGLIGPKTTDAVKAFQASAGLAVDGLVGPQTTAALR